MDIELSPTEARVIGCLIEKAITTPDQYPLSLNALTNGCNQKSNRDPVMSLDESTVQQTVDDLKKRHLVSDKTGYGSRVTKYHHRFCNTEFSALRFSDQELGIICELLLRGPQSPGELRSRTQRLCKFADVHAVEAALRGLAEREDGPFVAKLSREPGKREARYAQLFTGETPAMVSEGSRATDSPIDESVAVRLGRLEERLGELSEEIADLKHRLGL